MCEGVESSPYIHPVKPFDNIAGVCVCIFCIYMVYTEMKQWLKWHQFHDCIYIYISIVALHIYTDPWYNYIMQIAGQLSMELGGAQVYSCSDVLVDNVL